MDLFPTACELTGLPTPESVEGKSLVPILDNPKSKVKDSALSFVPQGTSLRTKKWSYMKYKDGSEELYDMKKDPKQYVNLVFSPDHQETLHSLRKRFNQTLPREN